MTPAQWNEYQRQADVIDEAKKWKEKQTAVNWMIDQLIKKHVGNVGNEYIEIFEQAKNMEQGQICLAFLEGQHHSEKLPSQYYIDTYGSKKRYDDMSDKEIEEWGI